MSLVQVAESNCLTEEVQIPTSMSSSLLFLFPTTFISFEYQSNGSAISDILLVGTTVLLHTFRTYTERLDQHVSSS